MRLENIITCFLFFPKKTALRLFSLNRIRIGKRARISSSVELRLSDSNHQIVIGDHVSIRPNTEIHAFAGSVIIGNNVFINRNCMMVSHSKITIGSGTTIGPNTLIYDHDHKTDHNSNNKSPVTIGENCWIAGGCIILKGVTIGDNSIVAAGSVITKDVEKDSLVIQKRLTHILSLNKTFPAI